MWLGTSSGISFFDVTQNKFTNYTSADGVVGADFNSNAGLLFDKNIVLLGGTKGLNYFDISAIKLSSYKPSVVLTDFQIFNNSVSVESTSVLTKNIFSLRI